MVTYRSHLIAREGWLLIAAFAGLGLILHVSVGFYVAIPCWIATLVLCILFRNPKRVVPPKPLAIVSPMDGRVTAIDTLQDPYTETKVVQIQLNKEFFDVMTTRSPMEGKIIKQWFAVADTKSADHPVSDDTKDEKQGQAPCKINSDHASVSGIQTAACRFAQWIQSDEHDDVVMAIKSATRIFKPRCYSQSGDRIGQGQCCGYIPFAAVIQVSVPASSRIEVNIGDRVRAGSDIIATLVH